MSPPRHVGPPGSGGRGRPSGGRANRDSPPGPRRRPGTGRPPEADPARQAALDLLGAVRERGAYANLALPSLLRDAGLRGRDAALATELGYGACRALGQLDAVLAACGDRPMGELDGPVVDALRLGAYQLLHTRIPPHAAVSATVDLVRIGPAAKAAGYVNAVLRRVSEADLAVWVERLSDPDDAVGRLALSTAHPRWIVLALADALGVPPESVGDAGESEGSGGSGELVAALVANDRAPRVHLVARPGRIDRDELVEMAGGIPGRYSPYAVYSDRGDPSRIPAVADRRAAVQDEGSQLVALALVNAPVDGAAGTGERWLDLAAGPGGKAGLLGALAAQRGAALDAVERSPHRADLVRATTAGLPVTVHTADGRDPGLPEGSFDRVLLDAPCSGLGALRRRPEARWRRTEGDVGPLVTLQRELLASAARLVRPGGVVGYVTCSPHLSETAGVVARRDPSLAPIDARPLLPGVPSLAGLDGGPTVQLWPHRHGTDGMFLALFRRAQD